MSASVGNLALLLNMASPWAVIPDRKTRPVAVDVVLNLPKRDPHTYATSLASKSFESDGEARSQRVVARGKANSKMNGVDFDSHEENGNGNGNGNGERGEEEFDWEKEMRKRVKEIEEMRELEKKAEELQNKAEDSESEDREETEEEKKMRVRKELEKVPSLSIQIDRL